MISVASSRVRPNAPLALSMCRRRAIVPARPQRMATSISCIAVRGAGVRSYAGVRRNLGPCQPRRTDATEKRVDRTLGEARRPRHLALAQLLVMRQAKHLENLSHREFRCWHPAIWAKSPGEGGPAVIPCSQLTTLSASIGTGDRLQPKSAGFGAAMIVSASALTHESPRSPTDGSKPALSKRSVKPFEHALRRHPQQSRRESLLIVARAQAYGYLQMVLTDGVSSATSAIVGRRQAIVGPLTAHRGLQHA